MPRYGIDEMCANVVGTDVGTTKPSFDVEANGSSICAPITDCVGARARRIERYGLSSDEIDMDEPNERSRSFIIKPSRERLDGEEGRMLAASSPQPAGAGIILPVDRSDDDILLPKNECCLNAFAQSSRQFICFKRCTNKGTAHTGNVRLSPRLR